MKTADCTFDPATRTGTNATLIGHTAVVGVATRGEPVLFDWRTIMRQFRIGPVRPYAQYQQTVDIDFVKPGKRLWSYHRAYPDNLTYFTITNHDKVLYDSRDEVPCDMTAFAATRERFAKEWKDGGYTVIA